MQWRPETIDGVKKVLLDDLSKCNPQQVEAFRTYGVEPSATAIRRHGQLEAVVVVARKGSEAMYWEDVEEGFNTSRVGADGILLDHFCNQDDLGTALTRWISGEGSKLLPPERL